MRQVETGFCQLYQGSYRRFRPPLESGWFKRVRDWRADVGRTLDYLATRADVDTGKVAYLGVSYGASYPLSLLAFENRLKAAIFLFGGLGNTELNQMADPLHYLPHIKLPVLMLSGRLDALVTLEGHARPLYNRLGTPAHQKTLIKLDSGHGNAPRIQLIKALLPWLDAQLGKVH